jgi:hypothetical protein
MGPDKIRTDQPERHREYRRFLSSAEDVVEEVCVMTVGSGCIRITNKVVDNTDTVYKPSLLFG